MEHILSSQIMSYLGSHNIITSTQFDFQQNHDHSCESQLLLTTNDFARHLDSNVQVDIGILDFSKAFDKVPHRRLAIKLYYYGIRGNLLSWIECFLQNRTQLVVVEGHCSSLMTISSGVPQGTVLGLTLFLLYINDIDINIHSQVRLFVDDCLIYRPIYSSKDHERLQQDLNSLTQWATSWQMDLVSLNITSSSWAPITTLASLITQCRCATNNSETTSLPWYSFWPEIILTPTYIYRACRSVIKQIAFWDFWRGTYPRITAAKPSGNTVIGN